MKQFFKDYKELMKTANNLVKKHWLGLILTYVLTWISFIVGTKLWLFRDTDDFINNYKVFGFPEKKGDE